MDLLSDLLDKALECPVCLEPLDATSRVLPCQHTFCRRCLLEIIHSRRELLCPECRVQCDQSVDELPPNILLIRLLEGLKTNKRQSTDRNDVQNVNDLLELRSQPTNNGVGPHSTSVGPQLTINQLFSSKQIISQTTPHSQPKQSQSPQPLPQTTALPQQIAIKHPLPPPPQQTNPKLSQIPGQKTTHQILTQKQQSLVKQYIQTPNSLPGAKSLYNYDGKDLEDYVALYNYKPQKADELELKKGELYSVYKKCHDGWFKGVSVRTATSGVFPGNYVQLVKSCVQIAQYGCPVGSSTFQSRVGQSLPQSSSAGKEPPLPKPKPILPLKPSISLSSGVTPIESPTNAQTSSPQSNSATESTIVYARPRPTGQVLYDVSRNLSSLVPPPPPPQRPTRPLSSILVPNKHSNEDPSGATQLAQALNQSLLISKPQSMSQSSLNERTSPVWHQPKVAATRNTVSMMANSSTMHSAVTAITPPPNVSVMSSSSMTPISHRPPLDRKESKSKEKSNFIKRFTSSSKPKRKQNSNNNNNNNTNNHNNSHNNISNNSFSCDNPSFVDTSPNNLAPIHIRSGSCPNESLTDFSSHKKQSSFDDSNTVIKNRMAAKTVAKESPQSEQPTTAPPLIRERFRCVVPYPPNSEYELELKVGDVVYVHKKREDGWFKGTLQRTGKTGLFPGPFVESF